MKVKILKQTKISHGIKEYPCIIRQIGKGMFEYLLMYDGQFYGTFLENNLKWWQIKRFKKEPCTDKEIKAMIHFLTKAAESTIITLEEKKNGNKTTDVSNKN